MTPEGGTTGAPGYPAHWELDAVLADGGTVHVRPIRPDDAAKLTEFHSRLSEQTIYYRFFGSYATIPQRDLTRFTTTPIATRWSRSWGARSSA